MHIGKKKLKKEKNAMAVSLSGNVVFVIVEVAMAIFTGSQAVLLDAVYDSVEFFMLLPTIFLIPLLYRPRQRKASFRLYTAGNRICRSERCDHGDRYLWSDHQQYSSSDSRRTYSGIQHDLVF